MLAGFGLLVATVVLIPSVWFACFRFGMSDNVDELVANLGIVPKTIGIGLLGYARPHSDSARRVFARHQACVRARGLGCVLRRHRKHRVRGLARDPALRCRARYPELALFNLHPLLRGVGSVPLSAAVIGLLVQSTLAIAIL